MVEKTVFSARKKIGEQKLKNRANRLNSIQFHYETTLTVNGKAVINTIPKLESFGSLLQCTLVSH